MDSDVQGRMDGRTRSGPDVKKAAHFYKKACEQGELADACYRYSSLFVNGVKDVIQVKKQVICFSLWEEYPEYSLDFLQKNMEEAFNFSVKGCHLGSLPSCVNVSVMYGRGDGVREDPKMSRKYEEIAKEMQRQLSGDGATLNFGET